MSIASVGKIGLDLVLNSKNFDNQLDGIKNQAKGVSGKIVSCFKPIAGIIAAAFSTTAIVAFSKECIELGSDLSEVQNVVDVTFTSMNNQLNEWAKNAASSYGLSETMAKKYAGLYGSMASAFGFAEDEAYDMATALAGLSGDVASFYNISQDEAYTKLKAVFSGETETLKDLGIVMTQSALDSYALSNGFGKTVQQMTEAEKVSLRYSFVLSQLSGAQGDFLRTQDSWANQTRILQLRFDSLKATIGQGLIVALTPALKMLNTLIEKAQILADAFANLMQKIFGTSDSTSKAISSAVVAEQELTDSADDSASSVNGVTKSIKESAKAAKGSVASFDKLNIIGSSESGSSVSSGSSSSPQTTSGTPTLIPDKAASDSAKSFADKFKNIFKGFYEKSGFKDFVDNIKKGINKVSWSSIKENYLSIFGSLKEIIKADFNGIKNVCKSALGAAGSYFGTYISVYWSALETVSGGVAKFLEKDTGKITGFISTLSTNLKNSLDNISNIYESAGDIVTGSIEKMRPKTENAISDLFSGYMNYIGSMYSVLSDAFEIASQELLRWIKSDSSEISQFLDGIQSDLSDFASIFGGVFSDVGDVVSGWWNSEGGSGVFIQWSQYITEFASTLLNIWNKWISPVIDGVSSLLSEAWSESIKPVLDKAFKLLTKLGNFTLGFASKYLLPVYNFIIDILSPVISYMCEGLKNSLTALVSGVSGILGGLFDILSGTIDFITGVFTGDWEKAWSGIKEILSGFVSTIVGVIKVAFNYLFGAFKTLKIKEWFLDLWNNIVSGFNKIIGPWVEIIKRTKLWKNLKSTVKETISAIKNAFEPIATWFEDKFSQAWQKVKNVFSTGGKIFDGIKEGIANTFKNIVNGLISGINRVIDSAFFGLNNAILNLKNIEILGVTPFEWMDTFEVPQIPYFAKGAIVKAPTLAVVGDNPGASNGDPEVVSPLSKLQSMINTSSGQDVTILLQILDYLKRIYEMFVVFKNNGGNMYEFIATLDDEVIFKKIIKQNELYKKRHNGESAF